MAKIRIFFQSYAMIITRGVVLGVIVMECHNVDTSVCIMTSQEDTVSDLCITEEFEERRRMAALDKPLAVLGKDTGIVGGAVKDKTARLSAIVARRRLII